MGVGAEAVRCKVRAEAEEEDAAAMVAARAIGGRGGRRGEDVAEVDGEEPGGDDALLA
jgi:hypothetical protein